MKTKQKSDHRLKTKSRHIKASYPHFRYYRKSGHPALILGEEIPDQYKYRKVTHSEKEGRHINEKVFPNPNPKDSAPMYIVKRTRHDYQRNFEDKPLPWKYKNGK